MATLKSTALSQAEVISKDHALQTYRNNLLYAANLIAELEAMFHECLGGGLSLIDHNIIHRCKNAIGSVFTELDIFNAYIFSDVESEVASVMAANKNDLKFVNLNAHPRVKVGFNPRDKNHFDELETSVAESNESAQATINEINQLIANSAILTANAVRQKYTVAQDGYLIHLNFADVFGSKDALDRISLFISTVENLSLDELMISQQFSEWFRVEQANPFSLETLTKKPERAGFFTQSIAISVFNLNDYTASFYLSTILKNIKQLISNQLLVSDSLSIHSSKASINSSYVCVNLEFIG